ncbi:aminotransferase [Roseomonas sp. SSH11]|uniref:Aminotransferase n=1 Tax=Pararoseomonas baculiformis TaxID=2820812 RepID=A0ABS4ACT8_9PROT|nr:aminotransferase [Pararoseomonas baculiformis]MBP0444827.1 aminotransferase [Pararoseomonas baculiformis]
MPTLNPRLLDTGSPPIPEIQEWGARYASNGGTLLNMCQAVPSHAPAPGMLERLARAAGDPRAAAYGPILGEPDLRRAYATELGRVYGGLVNASHVAITAGCNQAYFVTMMALAQRGDAVLVPTPWYFNHQMTLNMLGVEPRPLPCRAERRFVPDPDEAEALIDDRVRAIVLVTPNNPTGAIYPPEVIARFHALCRKRGIWLVLDETYRDFLPPGKERPHGLLSGDEWPENLVQLYSFSKSFAIPGYRLGAIGAPASAMSELTKVMDCVQICAARAGQIALAWGLGALDSWRLANRAGMQARLEVVRSAFSRLPGWELQSLGAYFAYVRHPFKNTSAWKVAERLASGHGLMCLPGPAFAGEEAHLRIAFANVDETGIGTMEERLRAASTRTGVCPQEVPLPA